MYQLLSCILVLCKKGSNLSQDEMDEVSRRNRLHSQYITFFLHLQSLFDEKKSYFSKSIYGCNVVMAHNTEWEDSLTHVTIYDVEITLQLVRGWLASCNNFQTTIESFYSWMWMNLQDFI